MDCAMAWRARYQVMTDRSSLGAQPYLFYAALIAGASFWSASDLALPVAAMLAWKGAGVALLALWTAIVARERNGWLLAGVMAFGAAGDVLIDGVGLIAGAGAFLMGHLIAILLYLANRRHKVNATGIAIALVVPILAYALTHDVTALLYAIGLGGMAGAAWASRFPRKMVALGALMFVASDLLIFAQVGMLAGSILARLLIWPLYFAGQALIAYGVVRTLDARKRNEDLHHRL
jgi:uncharacterized membrane protein YhhN